MKDIVCWGDSLTAGMTAWPARLEKLINETYGVNISVANCGVGGETSSTIAVRAGAKGYELTVRDALKIPADCTPVPITMDYNHVAGRIGLLRQGGGNSVNPMTIAGVKGTLALSMSKDAAEGAWIATVDEKLLEFTFTRESAGEAVDVPAGTRMLPYGATAYKGRRCILYVGCNGGWRDIDELISQQHAILEACECDPSDCIIIGNHFNNPINAAKMDLEMAMHWGYHYLPLRVYFASKQAYLDAGADESVIAEHQECIDKGITSPYFLRDAVHMNDIGYELTTKLVFEKMKALGFLP